MDGRRRKSKWRSIFFFFFSLLLRLQRNERNQQLPQHSLMFASVARVYLLISWLLFFLFLLLSLFFKKISTNKNDTRQIQRKWKSLHGMLSHFLAEKQTNALPSRDSFNLCSVNINPCENKSKKQKYYAI